MRQRADPRDLQAQQFGGHGGQQHGGQAGRDGLGEPGQQEHHGGDAGHHGEGLQYGGRGGGGCAFDGGQQGVVARHGLGAGGHRHLLQEDDGGDAQGEPFHHGPRDERDRPAQAADAEEDDQQPGQDGDEGDAATA